MNVMQHKATGDQIVSLSGGSGVTATLMGREVSRSPGAFFMSKGQVAVIRYVASAPAVHVTRPRNGSGA
jgi:hypothetical protein